MLTVLRDLPHELLDCETSELDGILRGPTLIHLVGRRTEPLFVSVLLHGNEGTEAAGQVIKAFGTFVVGGNYVVGCTA